MRLNTFELDHYNFMIICPHCLNSLDERFSCNLCGYSPEIIKNIPLFSPDAAYSSDYFPSYSHDELILLEDKNFWFKNRNKIITRLIKKYFPTMNSFAEVGCGTGFVLHSVRKSFPDAKITAIEIYANALEHARSRIPDARLIQADVHNFPFKKEFDLVGMFDVLEHIDNDLSALKNLRHSLKPGGGILVTVPQHKWLWSASDTLACHRRRYTRNELDEKLRNAGFRPIKFFSFITFLLPVLALSRFTRSRNEKGMDAADELKISKLFNKLFYLVCSLERSFIKSGVSFPAGGSLAAIAQIDVKK